MHELTSVEAAAVLGVSARRLRQLVASGRITPSRRLLMGQGVLLFYATEIERFRALPRARTGRPRKSLPPAPEE